MTRPRFASLALLLCCSSFAFGEVHERTATVHGRQWLVKYDVQPCVTSIAQYCLVTIPATLTGQPHYDAMISVFETGVQPNSCDKLTCATYAEQIQVGESFPGQWTEKGCFEDDPSELVERVLGHEHATSISSVTTIPLNEIAGSSGLIINGKGTLCSGSSTGGNCPSAAIRCKNGTVDLNPVYDGEDVVLVAQVCDKGAWKRAQVKIGLGGNQ